MAFADFLESLEIRGVAAMKNRTTICADDKTAETAMRVGQKPRAPMVSRRQRNSQRPELDRLPFIELVNDIEAKPMNQPPHANRNNDWLIGSNRAQRSSIEMIEMGVSD